MTLANSSTNKRPNDPSGLHDVLYPWHQRAGAKFANFAGWVMPLEYQGVLAEHRSVRRQVGAFDVSHLGNLKVLGSRARDFLNSVLTNDLNKVSPGQAQYQMLCNETGGVVDDLIAYVVSDEEVNLIPNAANNDTVADIIAAQAPGSVEVINEQHDLAILAVQGPGAPELLSGLGVPTDLGYMRFTSVEYHGFRTQLCRTGYTGEKGFELVIPVAGALSAWEKIVAAGATPCGLGARDTLRTEMGYALHGNDISPKINPIAAGLSWAIGWQKPAFNGREALLAIRAEGPKRRLRGLKPVGRAIPRPGMEIVDDSESVIGVVTSGTFSPTLKQGIGLGLVASNYRVGDRVKVRIRSREEEFMLVKPPFVQTNIR